MVTCTHSSHSLPPCNHQLTSIVQIHGRSVSAYALSLCSGMFGKCLPSRGSISVHTSSMCRHSADETAETWKERKQRECSYADSPCMLTECVDRVMCLSQTVGLT